MKHPDSLILYVTDVDRSARFYHELFSVPIVDQSAHFAMLALPGGTMLGLWDRADVSPSPLGRADGLELAVTLDSSQATDAALAQARAQGVKVLQAPVTLDFGYTFVLESPDGHRIRVFNPAA